MYNIPHCTLPVPGGTRNIHPQSSTVPSPGPAHFPLHGLCCSDPGFGQSVRASSSSESFWPFVHRTWAKKLKLLTNFYIKGTKGRNRNWGGGGKLHNRFGKRNGWKGTRRRRRKKKMTRGEGRKEGRNMMRNERTNPCKGLN